MDTVEQAAATVERAAAPVEAPAEKLVEAPAAPQEQAAVTPAAPQDQAPVTAEAVTKEADTHKVCKNCNYHDPAGLDALRCPACNFRHASRPVHQAPVKKAETEAKNSPNKAEDLQAAPVDEEAKAGDEPAEEASADDKPDEDKPGADKPAADTSAEEVVDGQAVRVVEKIVIVEKAPTEPPVQESIHQDVVQDAGKAVEDQG